MSSVVWTQRKIPPVLMVRLKRTGLRSAMPLLTRNLDAPFMESRRLPVCIPDDFYCRSMRLASIIYIVCNIDYCHYLNYVEALRNRFEDRHQLNEAMKGHLMRMCLLGRLQLNTMMRQASPLMSPTSYQASHSVFKILSGPTKSTYYNEFHRLSNVGTRFTLGRAGNIYSISVYLAEI